MLMDEIEKKILESAKELFNKENYRECLKLINSNMETTKELEKSVQLILLKVQTLAEMDQLAEAIQVLTNCTDSRLCNLKTNYENQLKLESSINPKHPDYSKYHKFEEWIKTNEGKYSKLKIIQYAQDYEECMQYQQ